MDLKISPLCTSNWLSYVLHFFDVARQQLRSVKRKLFSLGSEIQLVFSHYCLILCHKRVHLELNRQRQNAIYLLNKYTWERIREI